MPDMIDVDQLLAEHLLNRQDAVKEDSGPLFRHIQNGYQRLMRHLVPRPVLILLLIVPFLAMAWIAFNRVGTGFMPHMDEGGFVIDFLSPPGNYADAAAIAGRIHVVRVATAREALAFLQGLPPLAP